MVPSSFVFLDRMPLTANGKVDRKALEQMDEGADAGRADPVLPQTPVEELIAGIWAEVLGVDRVSVDHNFFDLGGSSFLMMQVVTKARQHGLEFTQLTMFRYPNVRSLAEYLAGKTAASPGYSDVRDRAQRQRLASTRQKGARRRS
jgi:bacitracin synthase 3